MSPGFVRFYLFDIPVMLDTRFIQILLDVITETAEEEFLAIFCNKYQMHYKQILVVSAMLASILLSH